MAASRTDIKLKKKEKSRLEKILKKGEEKARKLTRCRILLMRARGFGVSEISQALSITDNTVRNICYRYLEGGVEVAINEKPRPGAPTLFEGKTRAKLTALACSTPPEGHSQWSLRLLADKAVELEYVDSISHESVGQILKKTKSSRIRKGSGA